MKNLANYISISRIILAILLLFTEPLSIYFFTIFILCGISDVLDGYIARNHGENTSFGDKLDSFGDIVFFLSFLIVIIPVLNINYMIILWIIIIFLIKISSICIGFMKFGKFVMFHTYLNKLTGASLVLLPFLLILTASDNILIILCLIATFASLEEVSIMILCK